MRVRGGLWRRADEAVANLYPGYFAMVMATGILSTSARQAGLPGLSDLLLRAALLFGAVLAALFAWRLLRHRRELSSDLRDPRLMFTFFTFVAGADVLAARLLLDDPRSPVALALACLAVVSWLALVYGTWTTLVLRPTALSIESVNGGWLVLVVATHSLAIVAVRLAPLGAGSGFLELAAVGFWSVGAAWYLLLIALIVARLAFRPLRASDLTPPYWINMGATAIGTVAAASVAEAADGLPWLARLVPALHLAMLALWAWSTWWIPLLLVMGVWKYGLARMPLAYEPGLWSLVFPIGMYSVATRAVAAATGMPFLRSAADWILVAGLVAWIVVTGGLAATLVRGILRGGREVPSA